MISRSLLLPGPQPPLSHFGVTLLRHCVTTGLRYTLYHLGFEPPEKPPVRITRLRLYLDGPALGEALGSQPGADEVAAALVEPGGAGRLPPAAGRLAAAAFFHRARLRLSRTPAVSYADSTGGEPADLWHTFLRRLGRGLRGLNDALLGETLTALARRKRRAAGRRVAPCLSRHAQRLALDRGPLPALGPPDPLAPSWDDRDQARPILAEAMPEGVELRVEGLRGAFRDRYRTLLDTLRPTYLELARAAAERGAIESPGDAFFLPYDLAADLAVEPTPGWLPAALTANRREYESALEAAGPPEVLAAGPIEADPENRPEAWAQGAIWPLM